MVARGPPFYETTRAANGPHVFVPKQQRKPLFVFPGQFRCGRNAEFHVRRRRFSTKQTRAGRWSWARCQRVEHAAEVCPPRLFAVPDSAVLRPAASGKETEAIRFSQKPAWNRWRPNQDPQASRQQQRNKNRLPKPAKEYRPPGVDESRLQWPLELHTLCAPKPSQQMFRTGRQMPTITVKNLSVGASGWGDDHRSWAPKPAVADACKDNITWAGDQPPQQRNARAMTVNGPAPQRGKRIGDGVLWWIVGPLADEQARANLAG